MPGPSIPNVDRPDLADVPDERVLAEAFHARRRGDHQEALERFLTVFQRDPANPFVLIEAARCEGLRLDFPAMRHLLAEAGARADDDPLVYQLLGEAWLAHHFPEEALAAFRHGRSLDPDDPELAARLLASLERANRLAEAEALLDSLSPALRRDPRLQPARAAVARRQGRPEKAVAWTGLVLREPQTPPLLRAAAEWEHARALDALGRPDEAWTSLLRAKAIGAAHPESEFERHLFPKHLAHLRGLEQRLTASHLGTWRRQAAELPPRRIAFLLGHPRSGTTLLERILDAHPEIAAASEIPALERCLVEYFATRPGAEPALLDDHPPGFDLARARAHYWSLLEAALPAPIGPRLLLDKNPALTDGVHAVLRLFPEARLLVMLRDPRDVILSCFFQDFGFTRLGVACHTLAGAVAAWCATMGHWLVLRTLIPASQGLEIRYEDFVQAPDAQAARILAFLGAAGPASPAEQALARADFIRTPSYHQLGNSVRTNAVGRWRAYAEHFEPFRAQLAPFLAEFGYPW